MGNSYRQILRSSSIIGGASVINIVVGLLRIKVAAVLLGPAGVGLIGLLTSLAGTASTIAGLGFGSVGTRQIAEAVARADAVAIAAASRALFWGTLFLSLMATAVFWSLRCVLAKRVLGDESLVDSVGWLALVVGLTMAAVSQTALLNGMRQIGDLARVSVLSALLSTVLGIGALLLWGQDGLMAFVIATPMASFLLGHVFVALLPKIQAPRTPISVLTVQWHALLTQGPAFMAGGVVVIFGHLLVLTLVQRQLGDDAMGYFQASSTISMTYIGFILTAMGTDYYPRLTAVINDHIAVNRLVNEQTEIALLLAGPIFLFMLGTAPWIITLLYSTAFSDTAAILRWQVLGNVLQMASWPLGIIILAAGDGRTYMLTQSVVVATFIGLTWIGLPLMGIEATGAAFLGMYVLHVPLMFWLAWRRTGFSWQRRVLAQFILLLLLATAVFLAAAWSKWLGPVLGVTTAVGLGMHALARLDYMANLGGPLGRVAENSRKLMIKMGFWHE